MPLRAVGLLNQIDTDYALLAWKVAKHTALRLVLRTADGKNILATGLPLFVGHRRITVSTEAVRHVTSASLLLYRLIL